jgi:hypothetical protein
MLRFSAANCSCLRAVFVHAIAVPTPRGVVPLRETIVQSMALLPLVLAARIASSILFIRRSSLMEPLTAVQAVREIIAAKPQFFFAPASKIKSPSMRVLAK